MEIVWILGWFQPLCDYDAVARDQDLQRRKRVKHVYAKYLLLFPADKLAVIVMHKTMGLLMPSASGYSLVDLDMLSKAALRADAARLVRLRHLGMLHVVQAPDETKIALAMVTEPLFASVSNVLGCLDNVGKVPKELKGMGVMITHGNMVATVASVRTIIPNLGLTKFQAVDWEGEPGWLGVNGQSTTLFSLLVV